MLQVKNIQKHYNNFFLDCSLNVAKGRITGLVGQNGAGKSTTFKAILDLISIENGSITIMGKDSRELTVKDKGKLGVVLSDSGFNGFLTVNDIIPILRNLYAAFDENDFRKKINEFQLPLDKKIRDFSTGMKVKLKVIIAVSHNANLLILDEPTTGLDVVARDELLEILRDFMDSSQDRGILISSHISGDLETLCDDVYMIHKGKIIFREDTDILLSNYALLKVTDEQYDALNKSFVLRSKAESYGYSCLTNQKQYYAENFPEIVIEKGNIDEIITMNIKGDTL